MTITNVGNTTATGVIATDVLPNHTTFVSASDGGTFANGVVTWNIASLAAGATVTRTVTVTVNSTIPADVNTIVNEVLSFEPERMLSIRVQQAPANFPLPQAVRRMWTVIYFQRLEPGMTNVRVVGLGFGEDADSHKLREYFRKGNAETLEQLQKRYWPSCALCEKDPSLTAPASTRK